jgi:hypothetical protein
VIYATLIVRGFVLLDNGCMYHRVAQSELVLLFKLLECSVLVSWLNLRQSKLFSFEDPIIEILKCS